MSTFVDDLELSVRTINLLKTHEVETQDQFMALTRSTMRGWAGCGVKTVNEIIDVQRSLRGAALPDHLIKFVVDNQRLFQRLYEGKAQIIFVPRIRREP